MMSSSLWPQMHLAEETTNARQLFSYLKGFVSLKGRAGFFATGTTDVWIMRGVSNFLVVIIHQKTDVRAFEVKSRSVKVLSSSEPPARNTAKFHAWYITAHLSAHLKACFREQEAKAA